MKRILYMILKCFFIVPVWFFKIWWYGKTDKYTEEQRYNLLQKITSKVNKAGKVTIEPHGICNLPKEEGYIMFPNHQGMFDVLALLETHKRSFTVVIKKEAENVMLLKQVIRLLKAQVIDRDDIRQSMKIIMQMTKEVKEGRNYVIFPEGTRSKEKNNLLEFKGGSFKSAMNAKCPIVPVALIDSYKAFDTNSIEAVKVEVHYLPPLYYDEYKDMKSVDIAKEVKCRIETVIKMQEK